MQSLVERLMARDMRDSSEAAEDDIEATEKNSMANDVASKFRNIFSTITKTKDVEESEDLPSEEHPRLIERRKTFASLPQAVIVQPTVQEEMAACERLRGFTMTLGTDHGLGFMNFRLRYYVRRELLKIHLVNAKNLVAEDPRGTSDPYVVIRFSPEIRSVKFKTTICKETLDPRWDTVYTFKCFKNRYLKNTHLILEVFDWDKIGHHTSLGLIEFELYKLHEKLTLGDRPLSGSVVPEDGGEGEEVDVVDYNENLHNPLLATNGEIVEPRPLSFPVDQTIHHEGGVLIEDAHDSTAEDPFPSTMGGTPGAMVPASSHLSIDIQDEYSEILPPIGAGVGNPVSNWLTTREVPVASGSQISPPDSQDERDVADSASVRAMKTTRTRTRKRWLSNRTSAEVRLATDSTDRQRMEGGMAPIEDVGIQLEEPVVEEEEESDEKDLPEEDRPFIVRKIKASRNLKPKPNSRTIFGNLLIGLKYSNEMGLLTAEMIKGRKVRDEQGRLIKVFLRLTHRIIKKGREYSLAKHSSSTLSNTLNPVWNEKFFFNVKPAMLNTTYLDIKMVEIRGFMVHRVLGRLRLGIKSYPHQRRHFQEMMTGSDLSIEHWHLIRQ